MGTLIAVLSGKGGTGKTSVCAALACALAQQNQQVLCIDCDVGLRNLDIALGMSDLPVLSFAEVSQDGYPLSDAARHPKYEKLKFLTAPMNCPTDQVDHKAFCQLLDTARKEFDYVLLDAPAGIEAGFHLAARYADRIIVVAGADPASIRDASRAAEMLEHMGKTNVRLVVNRISEKMVARMKLTVDDIMDRSGLPLLGIVPEDRSVVLAAAFGRALLDYSRRGAASGACKRIAQRIRGFYTPIEL